MAHIGSMRHVHPCPFQKMLINGRFAVFGQEKSRWVGPLVSTSPAIV
jgi:hypothetical protein